MCGAPPGVLERGGGGQGFFLALGATSQGQKGEGCGKDRSCSWEKRSDSRNRVGGRKRTTQLLKLAILQEAWKSWSSGSLERNREEAASLYIYYSS